jgi:hypothetical protein
VWCGGQKKATRDSARILRPKCFGHYDLKSNIQVRKKMVALGSEHNELLLIEKTYPWQYPPPGG